MEGDALSYQRRPCHAALSNPFITAPPPLRHHSLHSSGGEHATAAMTTVIHMDTSEGDGIQTAPESVVDDACISTAPRAADSAVGYAFYREGGGARGQVKDEGDSAIFLDKQIEAVTAYELTSAALGRLPTRTAPADHHVQGICRADKMMSRAEASAIRTDLNKPFSKASAHQHDISLGSADHQPADIVVTSPRTPGSKHVYVGALTTLSPTSSRFQVPKLTPSQPVVEPATRLVPRTTPPKDEEIPALIHAKEQSLCGLKAYRQTDCEDSRDAVEVLSVREEEEEEDDDDDDVEDDVAARVLLSLHKKDDMIEQLMRTVATLQVENTSLRSRCAAAVGTEAAPLSPTMGTAVSPERTKTSSPSWPATPVRWWKLNRDVAPSDGVQEQSEGVQHLERGGAHADVKLRGTLADSEAGQAVFPVCDVTHREVQSSADTTEATTTPPLKNSTGESLASGIRTAPSASPSTEEETVARARIAQLEWQLENLQQEKREDTHVLRDHIDHLTRELHRRNRDMARQQRQHKLEFAALQEEVKALANQLDEQARSSTSVAAAAAAAAAGNEPEDKEVMELRRQLAQARSRETQIRCDSAAMQQRWLQELNEQKNLLDEARTHAAQEETQHASMREHERQLTQVVAQQKQQQQQLEGQVSEYKAALAQAQRELAELRIAHQRTEETVSEQRSQIQCISHDLATAVLERTHHEQRATCVEAQVKLLQQQLRQAETTLSSQKLELETLRRERRNEVSAAFALQEEEHATLLKGVEGCMKGSEAVESALLKSERTRCEMASQLSRVLAERDEYHRLYREASVQSQAHLLEQQQLFSESSDLVCRQLQEAQRDLAHRTETLEMTQHELGTTQQRIESLRDELTRSKAAQRQLEEEREAAQKRHESQTVQLVQAKESLKEALQAQLTTLDILRKKEKLLRAQHVAAQRTMERRQEEQHVLQNIADLLWPHEVNRVLGAPPPPRILNSGAKLAPRDMPALSRSAIVVLKRNVSRNTRKSSRVQTRRSVCRAGSLFSVSNVDSESTVRPSRSTSSASSYATSVAMSAVSPTDALATPSTYGDAALNERQRSPSVALEENDAPANSGGSASAVVPLDPRFDSNLRAFELRQHQRPSGITHGREKQRGTIKAELPVLRFLRDIHGAVEQVCAAYASSQRELATKRAAVRALVKERKAQQAQLKELRATLQEQQHTSERLRRDAVQSVRAESQAKLTKVDEAWREKYGAGVALQLRSCEKQHRHAVAEALKACARHLQAELMAFVQRLPTTLSVGLARAAAASAESTRDKVLQKVRTQYERPHDTECAAHDDLGHHDSGAQGLHPRNAAAAADVSLLSLGLEVESEVQAECDVILRNVLGVTGGWEHLTSAVLLANNATALDHLSGTTPPSVASPAPQSYAFTHGSAVDDGSAPPGVELAQKIVVNAKRTSWTIEEMAELEEVIHAYLTRILSALTRTPSLSPLAGAVTCVSSSRDSDVRQDMEYHTRRAPTPFSGATSDIQSANSKGAAAREKSEEVLMTTALPRWMRPLGTSSPPYAPPLRSPAVEETATLPLPPHHQQPHLLGLLLDACVARVHEQLMMQGAKYSHQQQLQGHPSVTAEGSDVPYSDANVATVLSLSPFSEFCKLRDNWAVKPLIRGRYSGMCGGDPAQRERREDFEYITLTSSPSTSPQACGSVAGRQGAWGQVEAFSRSAAGKTIDPARQRTPLALEKSMHFLVEHYLRVPHTSLVYTEPFRIWGYLWDRFRSIRTTWGPQLPPSNVSLQGYVDSESNRSLSAEELHRESSRRVRWLEFTVAALAVGGAYLCCSPEGCQRFMQDKKQFLESMSQCFTDLTVFYRAEQRHRNAEFFSVLLLLYGLQQEMKVEDRSSFCCFRTVIVNGEPRLCPENTSESVNLAQVYRELEKQPYMLETRPVRIALELIHCWAARQWFRFFELCKSTCMTPLQRAVAFQSFTYCRYRAVLDLVLPNYYVYPKLRVRHTMPITELADQLIMHHDHCLEFLKRMGLGAQLELKTPQQQPHHAATLHHHDASVPPIPAVDAPPAAASSRSDKAGWHLNLCYPNSDPLITADELEKRCENKRILFFPTHPAFFGFRVSHEAYRRFPDAKGFPSTGTEHHCDAFVSAGERLSLGRGAVRSLSRGGAAATNRGNDGESGEDDFYADEYCNDSCNEELEQEEEEKEEEEEDGNRGSDDDVYEKAGEDCDSPPRRRSTASPLPSASLSFDRETALLCQLGCPVNLMEVLEVYCPPYNSDVAALRLSDAGEELFASLPEHRAEMLRRCRRVCLCARRWRGASRRDDCTAAAISDEKTLHWAERMEEESVSTASSFFDDTEDESVCDEENDNNDFDATAVPHPSGADVPSSRDSVATLEIINESRKLLSSIRNNPLYAAAAADCATTEQKAQRATQEQADVRGAAASTTTTTTSAPQASSLEPLSPTPRSKEKQVLALTRAGDCTVVPLPDNYSDDTDQRRKSHDSRDVESPTATLQPQRQAHLSETHVGAQTMTVDSETAPQKMRAAQLGRPMSIDREDSAETVASHQYSPAGKSAAPPLSVAMSPSERFADIPKPIAPVTANMFTPGRRKQICVAETDNTATTPAAGQREGSSTSNSSGSSAPMLGYSHLKPLKPSLSDAVEGDRHSEPLSGRDGSPSASALDDSEARSDSSSAESGAAPPPCSSLWGGQRHLPLPPPAATIDSFTPRQTIEESRASSAAAAPASHHTSREVAREVAGVKESSEDGVVEVQASSSPSGPSKRHVTEAGLQRGAYVKRPSSTLPPASSTNVFARACVPLIEEYLHHWMRLTHEDDRTVHAAAQYIVDIHESEAAEAAATHSASTTTEEGDEAAPAANTRRWSRAQRCVSKALEAKERSAAAAATWWRQRRLQNTASAMARVARQLLTTAVLRGNMSEYGQLMWDLSLSEPDPSRSTGRVPTFGDRLRTTDAARREATKARAADGHYDDKDDARAARLSRGCSAAMLSAGDVEAILAAAPTRTSNTLAKRSHDVGTAWSSAENAGSVLSSVPCTYAEEDADLGHAMVTSKAALNEAIHTLLRSTDRAGRLPSHDSLTASLSSAVDVSLDAVNASDRSRSACAAAALQLTSLYVWVSTESDDHGAYAASSVTLTGTSTPNATAFARLFQNERERWLVTVMLPATTFTAMANTAGVWCGRNDDERASWQHLNTSRRGGKRSRSSAQHSDAMEDTHSLTWLGDADMGLHNTSSPSPAALVARLFHSDRLSYVSVLPFARLLPTYSAGAAVCRARTLPLMTRITLYGCDTHTLPRLRVRRDGGVRLAQQHNTLSIIDGHTKVKQVTASQDSTRMPAMSHTHYTALLAIDLGESQYIAKSRHAFTAIAESHVAYTTAASTRSSATAMERNDHQGVVQEQNSVAGLLMCLIRSPGQVIDTVSIAATLESLFWDMWHHRHGTGDKVHNTAISAAPAPAVTYVEIVYGDAEGAQKAMTTGMQTLLSTYAEQATAVLAGDQ